MKQLLAFLFVLALVLGFSLQTHAALELRGVDTHGNRLIYNSDLNITWYDYSNFADTWQNQMDWAGALDVDFGGTHYTDWRLPSTVDGPYTFGFDGTTTGGYNITSSEMGYLYYTALGNSAGGPLSKKGDFQNLQSVSYWSGTEYATNTTSAWYFYTEWGYQDYASKNVDIYAIAVRSGDVTIVPEPISSILFLTGGATLIGRKYIRRKKIEV
jgi:hypothetical protein